ERSWPGFAGAAGDIVSDFLPHPTMTSNARMNVVLLMPSCSAGTAPDSTSGKSIEVITSSTRTIEPETMDEVAEPRIATQRVKFRIDVQKNHRSRMLAVLPLEVGKRFVTMSAEKRNPQTAVEVVVATRGTPLPFLERAICLFEAAGLLIGIGDVDEKVGAIRVELQSLLRRRDG